jgi:tagatose 6-phosphate kinase
VVLCGSLPDGLPPEIYGTLVTYAVEAGVPVILDAGGEELRHGVSHGPDLVVAETSSADPGLGATLIRLGAAAAAVANGHLVRAVSAEGEWTARVTPAAGDPPPRAVRGALVAGLVPGQLLGWSWPDRLRHALALAAGGLGETGDRSAAVPTISTSAVRDHVDLAAYERLLDAITVERSS